MYLISILILAVITYIYVDFEDLHKINLYLYGWIIGFGYKNYWMFLMSYQLKQVFICMQWIIFNEINIVKRII